MIDAFQDGHFARSVPANAAIFITGALLASYFAYLFRLKTKSKLAQAA
jgi:hypothetical protein